MPGTPRTPAPAPSPTPLTAVPAPTAPPASAAPVSASLAEEAARATRRQLLVGGAATLGAVALASSWAPEAHADAAPRPGRVAEPFTLGVASGEPLHNGVVLWTRLAPDPLAENGLGGMPDRRVEVEWQVSQDENFRRITTSGTVGTGPRAAHSVHVEVQGLRPGTPYYYRFRHGNEISPVGRTLTTPAPNARTDRFAFAFASCQSYTSGHFTAQEHLAREDLDLVVFLGDYIYETGEAGGAGRPHVPAREVQTLAEYRVRHAQYKADAGLQAAHAAFPWAVVFDDHELENNWADETPYGGEPSEAFLQRRADALKAYYEHMPLRRSQIPAGPDMHLYRKLSFGNLVDVHLLDTRQYRDVQVADSERGDPSRTLLGADQRAWLLNGLSSSRARWNVLAQQVFFSQRDFAAGAATDFSDDAWDNYRVERDTVRDALARVRNPVVITGDVHANYVCDVKADFDDPGSATVATELVGTSFTSGGDGAEQNPGDAVQLRENPHIRFVNRRRGYVRNVVTPTGWTADYRTLDYVTDPGAPITDRARFVIDDGVPGVRPQA
ncbi:alkaline phosphatase PhoD [Nocardiopsis tropica]|uniref:Alkaline phosphatase D family protein n=1 Tax=Streptomonospora nanhaiensis TaxID=1323731 RepID=A0ABY6YVF9_9ACTN|nr:alkaline phosphatase D family protein [Streptomonospora nanhaiensis]WAE76270.1 alkaline phosphatase D family protein [Streptomonospora nanhaiensis]